jgi:dTDP-4-amino-4,6-dideoxygalactose transaminase
MLLQKIWERGQVANNGPFCQELGERLRSRFEVPFLSLVSNGTLALQLAIKALDLKGEIITTPYSYVATTNAILWEGCEPVFVDICPKSFCLNPDLIEAAITQNTSAILATHVYGYPCNVVKIREIADRHGLKVIYDAAHAFGVRLHGHSLLAHGDCSTLSFHATKLFHTGEGGAVISSDEEIADRISLMTKFGHTGEENYLEIGINAKLSELHAAMGIAVLPHVEELIATRHQCSLWYDEYLGDVPLLRPAHLDGLEYNYSYYPVVFSDHDAMMRVRRELKQQGILARRYFYPSLNTLPFLSRRQQRTCPVSESIAARVLSLPLYAGLTKNQIEAISKIIRA